MTETHRDGGTDVTTPDPNDVMLAGAAAKHLGIDTATLKRWGDRGWLRYERLPNGYRRYRRADLDNAIQTIDKHE